MREYNSYLTQAFNMKNFDLNGKIDYLTKYQEAMELKKEFEEMKKRGEL